MGLWERVSQLTVQRLLRFPYGSTIEVEATKGTKSTIQLTELAALDGLSAELALLDGVLATAAEINRACDLSTRVVTIVATGAISLASHDGKISLLGEVGGDAIVTLTLPSATGSGARFFFVVSVRNTSNYVIVTAGTAQHMTGSVVGSQDGGNTVVGWEAATTSDTLILNGSTMGGYVGDWVELVDIATNQYAVSGQVVQTGTEASMFSATL